MHRADNLAPRSLIDLKAEIFGEENRRFARDGLYHLCYKLVDYVVEEPPFPSPSRSSSWLEKAVNLPAHQDREDALFSLQKIEGKNKLSPDFKKNLAMALFHRISWVVPRIEYQIQPAIEIYDVSTREKNAFKQYITMPDYPVFSNKLRDLKKSAISAAHKLHEVTSGKVETIHQEHQTLAEIIHTQWELLLEETMMKGQIADPGVPPVELWEFKDWLHVLNRKIPQLDLWPLFDRIGISEEDDIFFLKSIFVPQLPEYRLLRAKKDMQKQILDSIASRLQIWEERFGSQPTGGMIPVRASSGENIAGLIRKDMLSSRVRSILRNAEIYSLADLTRFETVEEFEDHVRNFGPAAKAEILAFLQKQDIKIPLVRSLQANLRRDPYVELSEDERWETRRRRIVQTEYDNLHNRMEDNILTYRYIRRTNDRAEAQLIIFDEVKRAVKGLMAEKILEGHEKRIATLRYKEYLTEKEIADELGIKQFDVRKALGNIRNQIIDYFSSHPPVLDKRQAKTARR